MESNELPDLFRFDDGSRVVSKADWRRRREELLSHILEIEYGRLPPKPGWVRADELHSHVAEAFGNARHVQYQITTGPQGPFSFIMDLLLPEGDGPFPVVLNGDGCWRTVTDQIALLVLARGYILAQFNRVTIVPDNAALGRNVGLYRVYPDGDFGAIAAWAWGYHRCVDILETLPDVDRSRISIVGHSRGGKTVLLAGAIDERIALSAPNNSGCCGAGCFRWQGSGSETIADITRAFPHWFPRKLAEYAGRETELPFDQHSLKALVAPRGLLQTEALADRWANPEGSWQTFAAAKEAYTFLGVPEKAGFWFREGGHGHGPEDWKAFLDFADSLLFGKPVERDFSANPFPALGSCFSWKSPPVS